MSERSPALLNFMRANPTMIILTLLGVVTLALYRLGVRSEGVVDAVWFLKIVGVQIVLYIAAFYFSLRDKDSRSVLTLGLVFAVLFRLAIVFSPPYLSDDIYRYIWDGRVQAAGINPYRYIPADESLTKLRDEKIYPNINRRDYAHTMYPPVAEGLFFAITRISESVTWMKVIMVWFEGITIWATIQLLISFGFARQRVLIYAWHPLTVWEFAGSGHLDAIAIAFIALALLARRKRAAPAAGVLLACATVVKFFPAVLLPVLWIRRKWTFPLAFLAAILLAYLPYLSVGPIRVLGFLPGYAGERGMVSGEQFFLLSAARHLFYINVPTVTYLICALLLLGALSVWLVKSQEGCDVTYIRNALIVASVFMLLLAPHFSWYFAWLIPFICLIPSIPVLYLTLASFVLYLTWLNDTPNQVLLLKGLIFVPFLILTLLGSWLTRKFKVRLA